MQNWYLVYSKPRREQMALAHLQNQGFIVFLPTYNKTRLKAGHMATTIEPLFPRYLFVKAKNEDVSLGSVKYTKGVADFVRFGGQLAVVPPSLIEQLANVQETRTVKPQFYVGDTVQISSGSFNGFSAVFQMSKARDRCLVLLEWLGQNLTADVALNQLTKIY